MFHSIDEGVVRNLPGTWMVVGNDTDGDGVPDSEDVCPNDIDPEQADNDADGVGDVCDPDDDNDGIDDIDDNCQFVK